MKELEKKILKTSMLAGEIMLRNGAETYRVEDTIIRICNAYNISLVEAFVTPTGMFVSIDNDAPGGDAHTFIKHIKGSQIDLAKVSKVNALSRKISTENISVDKAMEKLHVINDTKPYPFLLRVAGSAMVASSFTLMLGGTFNDFLSSVIIGLMLYLTLHLMTILEVNNFIGTMLTSAVCGFIALLCIYFNFADSLTPIMVGPLMVLFPGVALTTAIRDSISGDLLSGVVRASEAIFIAISIASGTGLVLSLWNYLVGGLY